MYFQLESPYLNNGHASGKLTVNGESHNYRAMFSLNNDHFLSGSFECLSGGFEAAFGLQSSALPSDFQVKAENKKSVFLLEHPDLYIVLLDHWLISFQDLFDIFFNLEMLRSFQEDWELRIIFFKHRLFVRQTLHRANPKTLFTP